MPTSALSFHCMICFEEFHHAERYPVVLPCGHTYVCHVCADRLDKCMECRTPLTWAVPKPSAPPAGNLSPTLGWSSRSSVGRNTSTAAGRVRRNAPVAMMEKKRLPLPKNVVLLSLMEATELASEMARSHSKIDSLLDTGVEEDEDDQEVDEDKKIKLSTSWTIGECGTYIVAAKDGLRILPSRPTKSSGVDTDRENKDTPSEDDVNALVRFFHLDQKVEASGSGEVSLMKSSSEEFEPIDRILQYGDRVQIVSLDDGWAKLARGYGFVRVNAGELVKVGGSVDRACRLEAFLHALSVRRKELQAEQSTVDNRFIVLINNLQTSLINDEDLTVIPGDTFEDMDVKPIAHPQAGEMKSPEISKSPSNDASLAKPHEVIHEPTPPIQGYSFFGGGMLQALTASVGSNQDNDSISEGEVSHVPSASQANDVNGSSARSRLGPSPPSPRSLSAGARAWREQNRQKPFRGVDFRTGMSGHQGLVSYMVHPHTYLDQSYSLSQRPRMSSYSGLTIPRR